MNDEHRVADHATADELLPWYVNGTLDSGERDAVRRHLADCAACRDSVALLSTLDSALDRTAATPILPRPQPERLLARIDEADRRPGILRGLPPRAAWLAMAASVAAAALAGTWLWLQPDPGAGPPVLFETVTSESTASAMDYVLELEFDPRAGADERERLLRDIGATDVRENEDGGYRLTVSMPVASLDELEEFRRSLASSPHVEAVNIVALQLPMRSREK